MTRTSTPSALPRIYAALLHHNVLDKTGKLVETAVTNLDIHDIARSSRTYGLAGYYIVNPQAEQKQVVQRILDHWNQEAGFRYNPDRSEAFSILHLTSWLDEAIADITAREGQAPFLVMTTARQQENQVKFQVFRKQLATMKQPILLVFGTGWGIEDSLLQKSDAMLEPIAPEADTNYNHLSVRSAAAIVFDRLLGKF